MSYTPVDEIFDPESIPESKMFEGRKVCISLPFYKTTEPRTAFAITALCDRKKTAVMMNFGDAFIANSRNKLADNFLKSSCEWQLCIDDDIIPPFGNAKLWRSFTGFSDVPDKFAEMNTIDRLLSSGKTLIGGLYFGRWANGKAVYSTGVNSKQDEEFARQGPRDLIQPVRWVGTGALLIHRRVYLDIEKKWPHLARKADGTGGQWFTSSEHDSVDSVTRVLKSIEEDPEITLEKIHDMLSEGRQKSNRNSGLSVGEDVQLCLRAAQAGHQPFVDHGLLCGHTGSFCYGPKKQL